ncbi:hypothetical protein F511_25465 [Dorcoceras hygrometricum]|uniref:Uncharacterized protein n=1 Tax=Dorcoceras hygrometricum TaxID=472368 RepID=A0A2Z7CDN7_9LAMI|nr:hypothetical protein F511_25465 [Dorcoceras hygrometricum]
MRQLVAHRPATSRPWRNMCAALHACARHKAARLHVVRGAWRTPPQSSRKRARLAAHGRPPPGPFLRNRAWGNSPRLAAQIATSAQAYVRAYARGGRGGRSKRIPCWHLCLAPTGITRTRLFSVDCGRYRQSGPRPEPRLLRQPALEALTNSARTDSPRRVGRKRFSGDNGRRRRLEKGGGGGGIQLAVGPQPLWLRNHNSGLAQRIMVKRLATSPHDPLGAAQTRSKQKRLELNNEEQEQLRAERGRTEQNRSDEKREAQNNSEGKQLR